MDEKTTQELDGKPVQVLPAGVAKEITLPSGKKATIFHGTGEHAQNAQEFAMSGDKMDQKKYMNFLMHQLIHIDGAKIFPEDFPKLSIQDYNVLQVAYGEVNF